MAGRNYLTTKDNAKRMSVGVPTVRRHIHSGELQAKRVKGTYRIAIVDFERFMFDQ
ncbi:MAG: helix-turn-helix domain-containing protein [Anaerolineales bacterium]|nr:helix-turn-helix domain-containing protein [Chloroflexota bacterium]MBL6981585.1 helix-turn-helix domain-containing protein [Anaerolineales bacterium]